MNAGPRWVDVPPERLGRWLSGFDERHHVDSTEYGDVVSVRGADGACAEIHPPFGPIPVTGNWSGLHTEPLMAHAEVQRRIGVLLVRLGGFAAGVFDGDQLIESKVDTKLVHGRQRNGGSSQARYARRRDNEVKRLTDAATELAVRLLLPRVGEIDALVCGGDKTAIAQVLADRRLVPLAAKATDRFLTVPDPRHDILRGTPEMFRAARIRLS